MTRTIIAVYDSLSSARDAVESLIENGYDAEDISVVTYDDQGQYGRILDAGDLDTLGTADDDVSAGEGAAFGALAGLAVGMGSLLIPGIGPVIAAGPLVSALAGGAVGAAAGAATGGLVAALVDMGVPEEDAHTYAESVRRGGATVIVRTGDDRAESAGMLMTSCGPIDIDRTADNWRRSGWNRFDEAAEPLPGDRLDRESDFSRTGESNVRSYNW